MAHAPRTLYARSGDLHLAYQVLGDGPPDIVASSYFPIDMLDEEPSLARFGRRLTSFSRLVRFNPRGLGLSDPVPPSSPPTLEQRMEDTLAVMDTIGSRRAAVFTFLWQATEAIALAATYPDRVSHLIVVNGTARYRWAPDYPIGATQAVVDATDEVLYEPDGGRARPRHPRPDQPERRRQPGVSGLVGPGRKPSSESFYGSRGPRDFT